MSGPHPSHKTRFSDASSYDEICIYCGATDQTPGGWGDLIYPCSKAPKKSSNKERKLYTSTEIRQEAKSTLAYGGRYYETLLLNILADITERLEHIKQGMD